MSVTRSTENGRDAGIVDRRGTAEYHLQIACATQRDTGSFQFVGVNLDNDQAICGEVSSAQHQARGRRCVHRRKNIVRAAAERLMSVIEWDCDGTVARGIGANIQYQ